MLLLQIVPMYPIEREGPLDRATALLQSKNCIVFSPSAVKTFSPMVEISGDCRSFNILFTQLLCASAERAEPGSSHTKSLNLRRVTRKSPEVCPHELCHKLWLPQTLVVPDTAKGLTPRWIFNQVTVSLVSPGIARA